MKLAIATVLFFLGFSLVLANGGDQRVLDGKYLVNLSRSPFTPRIGVKTAMLPSFVDIEKGNLITEDLLVGVRIAKYGGEGGVRTFIFEEKGILVRGGVLDGLSYTFTEPGLHEIFFDFTFVSNPEKTYAVPDFLIDVQKTLPVGQSNAFVWSGIAGIILGLLGGFLIGRRAE